MEDVFGCAAGRQADAGRLARPELGPQAPGQGTCTFLTQFSDEQLYQLYELKLATDEVFDPEKAQAKPSPKIKKHQS